MIDVAVVILTYNEELNIAQALSSVCGWAKQVFVFDSLSTDRTVEMARSFDGCVVVRHPFEDYGKQRNAALDQLPIAAEWILFLDADEYPSEALKREIAAAVSSLAPENGFHVRRRVMWMGKWIRHGYYSTWLMRLFRSGKRRYEARAVNEHLLVEGPVGYLQGDIVHDNHNGLDRWIEKHLRYAASEARVSLAGVTEGGVGASLFGTQAERKRWLRHRVWDRLPLLMRPVLYFGYRYILRGGFLDGPEAFSFHLLQVLWFQTVVDLKIIELRRASHGGADRTPPP